jgi:hypothetical protein
MVAVVVAAAVALLENLAIMGAKTGNTKNVIIMLTLQSEYDRAGNHLFARLTIFGDYGFGDYGAGGYRLRDCRYRGCGSGDGLCWRCKILDDVDLFSVRVFG